MKQKRDMEPVLLPQPRRVERAGGTFRLTDGLEIALVQQHDEFAQYGMSIVPKQMGKTAGATTQFHVDALPVGMTAQALLFTGERLERALAKEAGVKATLAATASSGAQGIVLQVVPDDAANPEAYRVEIGTDGVNVRASAPRGVFYGAATLIQLVTQYGAELPGLVIEDAPDFANRGVMWDISRTKVPTLETLFGLIDLLASFKVNQLQLYTEHTFAYREHKTVWRDASPLTAQDILELDAYCRERFIELVPNQNSFGHMHRWLRHDEYKHLAEDPAGYTDTKRFWWAPSPFGLNATDSKSLEFLSGLYDELLPNFTSPQFNVGLDETIDLGKQRSADAVKARGEGAVYLDFLKEIHARVTARGKTMMFWGDIIINHPELISQLPHDVIAMEWGYDARHPFAEHSAQFARAGIPFYVCPGTSSWISQLGRTDNAIANIRSAAENGLRYGAIGVLNTDWGDWGHLQFLPVSYLGLAYGAALSWGVETNREVDLPRALDLFVFRDRAGVMGQTVYDLGNVYRELGAEYHNASGLARILFKSLAAIRAIEGQTREGFRKALRALDRGEKRLARVRMERADARLILSEYRFAIDLARHGARRGLLAFEPSAKRAAMQKRDLDREMRGLIRRYKALWDARNRPGGYAESVGRMERVREEYR